MNDHTPEPQIRLSGRLRYRAVGADGVVVHLDTDRVIVVNDVGLYIIQSLQQPMGHQALVEAIVNEFDVDATTAAADLDFYLQQLGAEQLLEAPTASCGN